MSWVLTSEPKSDPTWEISLRPAPDLKIISHRINVTVVYLQWNRAIQNKPAHNKATFFVFSKVVVEDKNQNNEKIHEKMPVPLFYNE